MQTTFKVVVHRAWLGERTPDPETYFVGLDECIELIDAVLASHENMVSAWPAALIQIVPIDVTVPGRSQDEIESMLGITTSDGS